MGGDAAESDVGVGTIVAGTYEIVRMLGRGGMGAVWEGHHTRLPGKRVAIKVLHAVVAEDPESLARFRREAEIACRLGHPNIVEVHDFNKLENGSPYLILELLEGASLDQRLNGGAISVENCEAYLRQIGSALQCAHAQGVIHRDLKPQNIFLLPSPTGVGPEIIKVLDFGISKIRGSQTVKTQDSTLLGTPQYMAPEQAVGQHESVDARTDIFALGVMLYELLSGQPPFSGQNIPEVVYKVVHVTETPLADLVPELSKAQASAIHKALAKSQDDRFATVDEFVLAFTGSPLPEAHVSSVERISNDSLKDSIAAAETLDSSKIDLAKAATVASHSQEMPAMTPAAEDFGEAATIDSSKLDKAALASLGMAPAVSSETVLKDTPATKSGTGRLALIGVAIVGIAAAAFALTRGGDSDRETTQNTNRKRAVAAAVTHDASPPAVIEKPDASVPSVMDAGVVATITPNTEDPPDKENPPDAGAKSPPKKFIKKAAATDGLPAEVTQLLDEAKTQLRARNMQKVISLARAANRIRSSPRGYTLMAAAHCLDGDLPAFNQALRKLPKARARKARRACRKFAD